jgi:1-acyl-sn-glycerol-3-phosphate acyltransferase
MGLLSNLLVGAGALWPPVDQRPDRAALTREAIDQTVDFLARRAGFVALHADQAIAPDHDPYDLSPARRDTGRIAVEARPTVLPIFLNGLSEDLFADVRTSFRPDARRATPCIAVVGDPVDLSELYGERSHPETWARAADRMREAITDLGERERSLRARCAAGGIGDDHPGWLSNRGRRLPLPFRHS